MYYTCLKVTCDSSFSDILMAEISEAGFETFLETESGFEAYVELEKFDTAILDKVKEKYGALTPVAFKFEHIQKRNWNEEWERNYQPILIENKCLIRAAFHEPDPNVPFEVIVTPKMSFGTGHHQTTYLMIKNQLEMDHAGKRVIDAGCGTAILSIVASKRGAAFVEAFDIDEWSITNGLENISVNHCNNIRIRQGRAGELHFAGEFDIILANINKNVLLDESETYQRYLSSGGRLLLSGFYVTDTDEVLGEFRALGFSEELKDEREGWASLLLRKR